MPLFKCHCKSLHEDGPSVDHDEEQQFDRQGDRQRRKHHHPHGEQDVRDDEVDHEKGEIDQNADLKGRLQLGGDKRGDQDDEVVLFQLAFIGVGKDAVGRIGGSSSCVLPRHCAVKIRGEALLPYR